jgi:hypothetical protein
VPSWSDKRFWTEHAWLREAEWLSSKELSVDVYAAQISKNSRLPYIPSNETKSLLMLDRGFAITEQDQPINVFYQPPESSVNGWDYAPEEIPMSAVVTIELLSIVRRWSRGAIALVNVLSSETLQEIVDRTPRNSAFDEICLRRWPKKYSVRRGDYCYVYANNDAGDELTFVAAKSSVGWKLIYYSNSEVDSFPCAYTGCRLLTPREEEYLLLPSHFEKVEAQQ